MEAPFDVGAYSVDGAEGREGGPADLGGGRVGAAGPGNGVGLTFEAIATRTPDEWARGWRGKRVH